jgi:hypothetical protein
MIKVVEAGGSVDSRRLYCSSAANGAGSNLADPSRTTAIVAPRTEPTLLRLGESALAPDQAEPAKLLAVALTDTSILPWAIPTMTT